jgi:hypothetical protein
MNVLSTTAAVGESFRITTENASPLDVIVEPGEAGGPSYFQWRGELADLAALSTLIPLPAVGVGVSYFLDFNTPDWALINLDDRPEIQYTGPDRLFHITTNLHCISLNPDGEAHLPVMQLFHNDSVIHSTSASVIVDVDPVDESAVATTTLALMKSGDILTLEIGSQNQNPAAPADLQVQFYIVTIPVT